MMEITKVIVEFNRRFNAVLVHPENESKVNGGWVTMQTETKGETQSLRGTSLPAETAPKLQSIGTASLVSEVMDKANGKVIPSSSYWSMTSGRDLSNMLSAADYPEDVQHCFLSFYRDTVCPELGNRPDRTSTKSGLTWDGSPFEYSFELKNSTRSQAVRFAVDLSQLRPRNKTNPLSMEGVQKVVNSLAERTNEFNDTWYRGLV